MVVDACSDWRKTTVLTRIPSSHIVHEDEGGERWGIMSFKSVDNVFEQLLPG